MRGFLIAVALMVVGITSKAIHGNGGFNYKQCMAKHGLTHGMVRSKNVTEEQIDCFYACFMQRVKWLKLDGTFNMEFLNQQENFDRQEEAAAIVNSCNQQEEDNINAVYTCTFSGCLRRHNIANFFS